ncbi:lipopolysaccharide biosynthesis protein [Mucilaginibacter sp.]|uniref:lipopolysaccharide biosynthesis protein n=1 Tax=Mucilaginibacter sp. TaxID=1882438 RepID=UPI003D0F1421
MKSLSKLQELKTEIFRKKDANDLHLIDGKKRNIRLLLQLLLSFGYKGLSMILSFAIVPLSINLLGANEYGLWLTIFSFVNFFLFFDLGLGNGLKNKITISLANNDIKSTRAYISTGYFVFAALSLVLILLLISVISVIDMNSFLNTSGISGPKVKQAMLIVGITIITSFTLNFVYNISAAQQKISFANLGMVLNNGIAVLVLIYLNISKTPISITVMAIITASALILSMLITNVAFFRRNPGLIPSVKDFRSDLLKSTLKLSTGFFIVQIQVIIISFTDTIIINKYLGNYEVTRYNLVYKLFNAVIILLSLVSMPLWTVFTEAFEKKDNLWIKNVFKRFNYTILIATVVFILLGVFINPVLYIWTHHNYQIPALLITGMIIYHVAYAWNYNYSVFLNSISAIKVQLPYLIITSILNIPLCIYFIHLGLGSAGVVIASAICVLPFSIFGPYVAYKRVNANI